MKNVCAILRKNLNALPDDGTNAVLDELFLSGYAFEELRILPEDNEQTIKENITALSKVYQNVFLLVSKPLLPLIKQLLQITNTAQSYAEFAGAEIVDRGNSTLFLLSQDETESGKGFVKNAVVPFLQKKYGVKTDKVVLRAIGANHALLQNLLSEAHRIGAGKIRCNYISKYDEDVIEFIYDSQTPKMLVDELLRLFAEGLTDTMYALDNISIEQQLVELLKIRGKKLSVAESFTGGGIARRIVSVSGASEVYFEGLNTYNERSKMKRLGVSSYTLGSVGAVSEKTAYEMALGLLNTGDCDLAIATTGLANTPDLWTIMQILGEEETLERLDKAIASL